MLIGNDVSIHIMYNSHKHKKNRDWCCLLTNYPTPVLKTLVVIFKPNLSHVNRNIS